jgi:hypothetical protein
MKRVLERVYGQWSNYDPKSMAAFLASPAGEQAPARAYSALARSMAHKNPLAALEWASRLPEDRGLPAGSDALSAWWRAQPASAINWLSDLPSGDARRQPFFDNVIRIIALDPQAADQLAQISVADRSAARSVIEGMSIPEDRRTKLLEVLKPR